MIFLWNLSIYAHIYIYQISAVAMRWTNVRHQELKSGKHHEGYGLPKANVINLRSRQIWSHNCYEIRLSVGLPSRKSLQLVSRLLASPLCS